MKYLLFVVSLVALIITAGCVVQNNNPPVPSTPQVVYVTVLVTQASIPGNANALMSSTPTYTTTGPLFTAGDIVRSATGGESPAWLIVSYDPAGDSYTRALIYKNADGTWGYRVNSNTETSQRAMMENVYNVKIAHVTVASVPTSG